MNSEPTSSYLAADGRNTNLVSTAGNDVPRAVDTSHQQCPNCAHAAARIAADSRRIADLEAQVQFLTVKASAAVDRLADYEDELDKLASAPPPDLPKITINDPDSARNSQDVERNPAGSSDVPEKRPSVSNRFHSFLNRRGSAAPVHPQPQPHLPTLLTPSPSTLIPPQDLTASLLSERQSRLQAEESLAALQDELEELSASLFSQANEMVADERRARAKETERAGMWEDQAKALQVRWKGAEERAGGWEERARAAEGRVAEAEARVGDAVGRVRELDVLEKRGGAGGLQQREAREQRLQALERAVAKITYLRGVLEEGGYQDRVPRNNNDTAPTTTNP